jgi:DNA-binding LacI/PurR family transcriptional regulator
VQEVIGGKVDGVVTYAAPDDELVNKVAALNFPAVSIASADSRIPSITADDAGGARMMAQRLASSGHSRVLFRMPAFKRIAAERRRQAFVEECENLGVRVQIYHRTDYKGTFSEDEIKLLEARPDDRPTAIACWNDGSTVAAYSLMEMNGWTDRFALIGFDGFEHPRLPITITSIYVPWDEIARTAVDIVLRIAGGKTVEHETVIPVCRIDGDTA